MKLLLLKVLLQRRARDEGFTLPMVIALGLIMILLGMVNIVKSSEENMNTIAQSQRIDALAVAELGAAQYRQFLDRNRALILQNRSEWTTTTDVCDTISDTTNGWANNNNDDDLTTWRSISLNEVELGTDINGDGDNTDTDQSINIGSYKIVDYEFDRDGNVGDTDSPPDGIPNDLDDDALFNITSDDLNDRDGDGESDARGILTVKGRTPDDDASEAQIEVEIPVRINTGDLENLAPALWINQGTITTTKLGTFNIDETETEGNLVVRHRIADDNITWAGAADATAPCEDPPDITIGANTISVDSDPRGVPLTTKLLDFINNDLPATELNDLPYLNDTEASFPDRLGKPGDKEFDDGDPDNDPILYYKTTGALTLTKDLETDGVADVILYVNGDLTINSTVNNIGNNDPNNVSTNLQISTTGNVTVNTGGGTVNIIGLIHAPNGTFKVEGGGIVNVIGAIWANDFDATGATVNIKPDQTNTESFSFANSYAYYRVANDRDAKPITQPPTNWKTEEVENL